MLNSEVGHPLTIKPGADASEALRLPFLRLGAAVTYKAVKDLRSEDDQTSLDALLWLCLDEMPRMVLDLLNFENDNPAILLSRGLPDRIQTKPRGRKLGKKFTREEK
jgi:hypothetical protein